MGIKSFLECDTEQERMDVLVAKLSENLDKLIDEKIAEEYEKYGHLLFGNPDAPEPLGVFTYAKPD
jgi:hypothetical protein